MTRFYMVIETGSVYSEDEIKEYEAQEGVKVDWSAYKEVWPLVENADESLCEDWTDDPSKAMTGREEN